MPATALTGSRIREERLAKALRQADLAARIGISPSYLNLIEHNRRRVSPEVLQRLADVLGLEIGSLGGTSPADLIDDLRAAVAAGPAGTAELDRVEDFAGRFPGWAALVAAQHRRTAQLERAVEALNDRMTHDPHLSATLHDMLSALSSVRSTAGILAETQELDLPQRQRFHRNLHHDAERLAVGAEALVAYLDRSDKPEDGIVAPQEELESWLGLWGWHLAELEQGNAAALEHEILGLASSAARDLARVWVRQAATDASQLPLGPFRAALAELGPDPALLAHRFGVGMLSVFRRLAMLPGGRFGLVICDGSGTLTFRKSLEGFPLPRFGAACPLWPIYTALSRPMAAIAATVETAGQVPQRFAVRAFCQVTQAGGFGGAELREAAMLIWHEEGAAGRDVIAVGSTCRICPRGACPARREPSILTEAG